MKKLRNIIILVLLAYAGLLFLKNLRISATDYYIATTELNVRTGAGTRYPVSFTLSKGDEVEVLSKNHHWYKINHLGKTGYASSKYLKHSRTVSNKPFLSPQQKNAYSYS